MRQASISTFTFYLVLLFCAWTVPAFSQTSDTVNQKNSKGERIGLWKEFHESGGVRYQGYFKNGKPTGEFNYFDKYGNKTMRVLHKANDSSAVTFYHKGEKVMGTGQYYKQKKVGIWKNFDPAGDILSQSFYIDDKLNGPSRIYYKDGSISEERHYKNGVEHGKHTEYHTNGKVKYEASFVDGYPDGEVVYFYETGRIQTVGYYRAAVRNGAWRYYNQGGDLEYMRIFENGYDRGIRKPGEKSNN